MYMHKNAVSVVRGQSLGNDNTGNDTDVMPDQNAKLRSTTHFNTEKSEDSSPDVLTTRY